MLYIVYNDMRKITDKKLSDILSQVAAQKEAAKLRGGRSKFFPIARCTPEARALYDIALNDFDGSAADLYLELLEIYFDKKAKVVK